MIPNIIHYCWFSRNSISKLENKSIESWKKYSPNYEIIVWEESNYDFSKHFFTKQAYKEKNWTYITDYFKVVRLNLLINIGLTFAVALIANRFPKRILFGYEPVFTAYIVPFVVMMGAAVFAAVNTMIGQIILSRDKAWFGFLFNFLWGAVFLSFIYLSVLRWQWGVLVLSLSFLCSYCCHMFWQYCYFYFIFRKKQENQ